jgi:hypothetical protein
MSDLGFLDETSAESGLIAADRLSDLLHITRAELATALGLSRDAISKSTRVGSPATQARLRDVVEIINRARGWAGSPQQAFAWYRSQPLPSFGDQTAEALVKEGRAEAVKRHLDRIAVGAPFRRWRRPLRRTVQSCGRAGPLHFTPDGNGLA